MIEGYIETHPVFTRQELMDSCGDTQNNANLLYRAKRAGKVASNLHANQELDEARRDGGESPGSVSDGILLLIA